MVQKLTKLYFFLKKSGHLKEARYILFLAGGSQLRKTAIAMKALEPSDVHKAATEAGIAWDNDEAFMDASEALTGNRHLDDMDPNELQEIINAIEFYKKINKEFNSTDNTFKNELGNDISISVEEVDESSNGEDFKAVSMSIEGPDSVAENVVTYFEAQKLNKILNEFLKEKGKCRSRVTKEATDVSFFRGFSKPR